jgi:hypothetical protein
MIALLLFCHQFRYEQGAASWLWLLPAVVVGAGFAVSLAGLVRGLKGGKGV